MTVPGDLRLTVKGVGRLTWPLKRVDAQRLIAIARPARYGVREETRLDTRVRDTWEIPQSRLQADRDSQVVRAASVRLSVPLR